MGVNVIGLKPENKKGESFDSNWWFWRKIWSYTCIIGEDLLSKEYSIVEKTGIGKKEILKYKGFEVGEANNGFKIPKRISKIIGERILKSLEEPKDEIEKIVNELKRDKQFNKISNEIEEDFDKLSDHYFLDKEFLKEWGEFCIFSGGFAVY